MPRRRTESPSEPKETLRTACRRFVAEFAGMLANVDDKRAVPDGDLPLGEFVQELLDNLGVPHPGVSQRTVQKWCQGRPPQKSKVEPILKALVDQGKLDDSQAQELRKNLAVCRALVDAIRLMGERRGPLRLQTFLAQHRDDYVAWFTERHRRFSLCCEPVQIHARLDSTYGGQQVVSSWSADISRRVAELVADDGDFTIRVDIEGPIGSGKTLVTHQLVEHLLADNRRAHPVPPFPVLVDWRRLAGRLDEGIRGVRESEIVGRVASLLFRAAGPPSLGGGDSYPGFIISETDATAAIMSQEIAIILEGVDDRELTSKESVSALARTLRLSKRLVYGGVSLSSLVTLLSGRVASDEADVDTASSTILHAVRLQRLDARTIAERCREELLRNNPGYGDLSRLGESAELLTLPGVAGRVIAHLRAGLIGVGALTSDLCILGSLYCVDAFRRGSGGDATSLLPLNLVADENESALNRSNSTKPPGTELHLDGLMPIDLDRIGNAVAGRIAFDKRKENRGNSILANSNGDWLFKRMDDALLFLESLRQRRFVSSNDPVEARKTGPQIPAVLQRFDAGAIRVLSQTGKWNSPTCEPFLTFMLEKICRNDPEKASHVTWSDVRREWEFFVRALPMVGEDTQKQNLELALSALFHPERDHIAGQTTFRWYGARAAAHFLDELHVESEIRRWFEDYCAPRPHDRPTRAIFLAEVAANQGMHVPIDAMGRLKKTAACERLAKTIARTLDHLIPVFDDENGHIRHARFHLWESLTRVASVELLRLQFLELADRHRLLGEWPPRGPDYRAIESATVLGVLFDLGVVPRTKVNLSMVAEGLCEHIVDEVHDENIWKSERQKSLNKTWRSRKFQIHAHMFLAFQHISAMLMPKSRHNLLNNRLVPYIEKDADLRKIASETGYLSWMLDWIERESFAGVFPDRDFVKKIIEPLRDELRNILESTLGSDTSMFSSEIARATLFGDGPDAMNWHRLCRLKELHGTPP